MFKYHASAYDLEKFVVTSGNRSCQIWQMSDLLPTGMLIYTGTVV